MLKNPSKIPTPESRGGQLPELHMYISGVKYSLRCAITSLVSGEVTD